LEGMQIIALCHTEMDEKLAALRVVVSSTVELALGHSSDETFQVEVVGELVAEFWKPDKRSSRLEWPGMRTYDLLVGPPPGRARLVDHLDKAIGQLGAELAARREVDAELEALWTLGAQVWDLVLDNADRPSSMVASLSTSVEL
jgi:hypothetical protein